MGPYIFGKRSTIHIIDIRETVKGLLRAKRFVAQLVGRGKDVLFVGTKRQARLLIRQQASRVEMPYVAERWLGGTLTNFRTIRSRIGRLEELEAAETDGTALEYSKKMIATRARELRKIRRNLEGIRKMTRLPGALIVIDVHRERNAVREAKKLGIPTVCLIDTDSDPDYADLPIPGNDDAMRAIEMVLVHLADAVQEGIKGRAVRAEQEDRESSQPQEDRPASDRTMEAAPTGSGGSVPAGDAVPTPQDAAQPSTEDGSMESPPALGLTHAAAAEPETST